MRRTVRRWPTFADVRRLALALPGTAEGKSWGSVSFKVKGKLFVWERPLRKADREALGDAAPDGEIVGVRVEHDIAKQALLAAEPERCFTTPHFDGYPIVLVRLDRTGLDDLEELITEAWLCRAPKRLVEAFPTGGPVQ